MPEFDFQKLFSQPVVPEYVATVMNEYMDVTLERLKISEGHSSPENPVVISVVRNENERLPDFFRHYRQAGIEKFVFLDNGSSDGTTEFLAEQADTDVYRCTRPFDWMKKHGWINLLISMYGRERWYIYVDGDEHLVFDGIDEGKTFADVAKVMQDRGLRRVRGCLIDMYSDGPLLKSSYNRGERLLEAYPYFDGEGYKEEKYKEIISRKGGPRQRAFGQADKNFRPEMTKYPMFRLSGHDVFANPHHIWPYEGNFVSECYFGILHFKFLPDVQKRIEDAIENENYWGGSLEYKCYQKTLRENNSTTLLSPISQRYKHVSDLVELVHISKIPKRSV
ncbi:glycosyltransferase family 2 protein [Hoeflea ulvae]|uniref:Glycosyltransferase family 2 protein n=1 Tax=Hoeflea ulvae TaxID=2983764 RepID=A0ABT3YKH4_9HYPH|nr:glycosyltransferase family 2 protein [Hoeflea ulvae]MCY0096397.1 glycosyltransferase family 2 protein [Hoeflea ulvae]